MFGEFPKLYGRASAKLAEAQANFLPDPLIIHPLAQCCMHVRKNILKLQVRENLDSMKPSLAYGMFFTRYVHRGGTRVGDGVVLC